MGSLRQGRWRHLSRFAFLTLAWGLAFGLVDSELDRAANWLYAAAGGLGFVLFMLWIEAYDRYKERSARDRSR